MIEQLMKLGLRHKEAKVYMACLELGEASPVSTIAKKSEVNRTTTYDIVQILMAKGLVTSSKAKKYVYFQAQPPDKLVSHLKQESKKYSRLAEEAHSILPELNTHYRALSGRPRVYFYEGNQGLIRVYEETLGANEEIRAYASHQVNEETIPRYFPDYYRRRTENEIPIRAIFPDEPENWTCHARDEQELRQSRMVPKSIMDFTPEINIFDNKVMIADWKEKLGIIIESEEIAKVFKQSFELAWEAAEKHHEKLKKSRS